MRGGIRPPKTNERQVSGIKQQIRPHGKHDQNKEVQIPLLPEAGVPLFGFHFVPILFSSR